MNDKKPGSVRRLRHKYHNEKLEDIVTNTYEKNKILRDKDNLIQQYQPIYFIPDNFSTVGIRAHFYAPKKLFFGRYYDTFWFDVIMIWVMSFLLYIPLYYNQLRKLLEFFGAINWSKFIPKRKVKKVKD